MLKPTLVSSDMRYWRIRPDARLIPWLHCYYIVEDIGSDSGIPARNAPSEELLLPDGHSEIVFSFGAGFERWAVGAADRSAVMQPSYLIGGRSHSVLTRNLGPLSLVGVKLDSRALRTLIATPLAEFRDSTLTLRDLNDRALLELEDALAQLTCADRIAQLLDRFFLRALLSIPSAASATDALLQKIRRERGLLSIMDWIRDHRIDSRNLERQFCAWTGMTPKRFARVIRFKHSYHRLIVGPPATATHLDGYYDQSHFNREFRYFTGAAPGMRLTGAMQPCTTVTDHLIDSEFGSGAGSTAATGRSRDPSVDAPARAPTAAFSPRHSRTVPARRRS
ncbi:MAG TPA: helix-turn-helix domain-containing protein [Povalibacter sp.]|nr:helix-turn-helix domain-containing protein [Povalibacter sp.]